jgi:hypothetical protein
MTSPESNADALVDLGVGGSMGESVQANSGTEPYKVTAPVLTTEQRQAGQAKSLETRKARQMLKLRLMKGDRLSAVLEEPAAATMKVMDLLMAIPHIGLRRAQKILAAAGIPEHNTVRACGYKQIQRLLEAVKR